MRKFLSLLFCIAVLLVISAGCSYNSSSTVSSSPGTNSGTNSSGINSPSSTPDISGSEKSSIGSEGAEIDEGVSENITGSAGQTESEDKAAANWEPTAFEDVNDFDGVSMTAKEGTVSDAGLTLVFENVTDSECIYGEYYTLEMKTGGNWFQVPVVFEGAYGFDDIGYILKPQSESEWTSDWEWLYGSLEPGEYRIIKDILDFRDTGDYDKYFLAAEFIL